MVVVQQSQATGKEKVPDNHITFVRVQLDLIRGGSYSNTAYVWVIFLNRKRYQYYAW